MKRTFNSVMKWLFISSLLVGSLIIKAPPASASSTISQPVVESSIVVEDQYRDETAMISNLKMSTKLLDAAIELGDISSRFL